jgi:MFS transporter, DHA1 family, multidrug resistance protein
MQASFARNAVVLGLITAVGPFAIDMYLPALPAIAADLNTSAASTQASLMSFFLAVALCQLVYGPVSDSYGRKAPLYFGLVLFTIGSIGCSLAPSIDWLIAARFVQGIGACAGMVIPRAVVRDLHTGHEAARLMALIMLVFSVSPILAPVSGSVIAEYLGWREIFWAVAVIGIASLALTGLALKETRPAADRIAFDVRTIARNCQQLLGDRHFLGVTFIGGFGMASFFAFLAGSSFVYIEHFGLTPTQYGMAFAVNAIAFIGMAQLVGRLGRRFGLRRMVNGALTSYLATTSTLLLLTVVGVDNVWILIGFLFVSFGAMGLVIPSTAVLALEDHGPIAGTASAFMGTLQLLVGAAVVGLIGAFGDGAVLPMVAGIVACAIVAFVLGRLTLGAPAAIPEAAE